MWLPPIVVKILPFPKEAFNENDDFSSTISLLYKDHFVQDNDAMIIPPISMSSIDIPSIDEALMRYIRPSSRSNLDVEDHIIYDSSCYFQNISQIKLFICRGYEDSQYFRE